ncbi:MAG: hypothetical protein IIB95_04400 [Candidatus Marinimicrobia bacterium]|nr:hypothetical protein [Candidatus Neomarinimicrobiota bacterium]
MNNNVIIDIPERIDQDMEDFKIDAIDDEKNYTASRIKLCRDPENEKPILFYSQELSRNFRNPNDPFSKRHIIKTFTPENITAVADVALEHKFKDTLLAHKDRVRDYNPLSDIHSQSMNLFMDEDTAEFLEDAGIRTDGMAEDFQSLESVEATPFMEDVSLDATRLKDELKSVKGRLLTVKGEMADEFIDWLDPSALTDDEFDEKLANEKVSEGLVQTYLALKDQINSLRSQLGEVNMAVFNETKSKIKLPKLIEERSIDELLQI